MLAGKADCLKEYTVGTEVYGRSGDYDPTTDTIVRTEARRLRAKLKDYYADPSAEQRWRINLVAGSYVPVIEPVGVRHQGRHSQSVPARSVTTEPGPLSLCIVSFNGKGAEEEIRGLAEDLEEELTHELAQNRDLKVFRIFGDDRASTEDRLCYWTKSGVQYALRGSIRQSMGGPVAQMQLTTIEGMIVWSERFLCGSLTKATGEIASAVCKAFFPSSMRFDGSGLQMQMLRN
jgi:TolB-like protein